MPLQIIPLTPLDIPSAITTIQLAFANDPFAQWIYNDPSAFSLARNRVSLGIRCQWGIHNALFYVAKNDDAESQEEKDRVLGIAMWMPPTEKGTRESWSGWGWGWWLWARQVGINVWWGRGGLNVKRYYLWKTNQSELQSRLWTDPHGYYFCNILTVLPSVQRKGIGKALMHKIFDQADKEGRHCYLESSRWEPNVKIYEKLGFRVVGEMECEEGGDACKLYSMIREPMKLDNACE